MRSIKQGRGPSMMGGVASICAALFAIIWTILAVSIGGGLFALFGVVFILMAIASAIYNFKNATSPNRYSLFDITGHGEEPDPLNTMFGGNQTYNNTGYNNTGYNNTGYNYTDYNNTYYNPQGTNYQTSTNASKFCPYCGTPAANDFEFCNSCGKKLP